MNNCIRLANPWHSGSVNPLLDGFVAACRTPDRRPVWKWCEDHIIVDSTSPMPGRWRSDNSPWVREVMEAWQDNRIRDITIKCAAQSAKTQTAICCLCWSIVEDPGPALWVMAARDEVGQAVTDRIAPTFDLCEAVKSAMIARTALEFHFHGMPLYFVGSGSKSKLQSKPVRWLILDEVRNYPDGALDMVLKRTRAFWNARRLIISTPDKVNDAVDIAFRSGDQRTWHWQCPRCHTFSPLVFERLKWDTNERTKPNGKWNYDALAETIRLECPECGHAMRDNPLDRKLIARTGKYVRMNPSAPAHRVSFHWNALLPPWVPWRSLVEEFHEARNAARNGNRSPLKTFINESLGDSWDDQLGVIEDYGFLEARKADYDYNDIWAEEASRFMAADKQAKGGEHYWYAIRAFGKAGKSRLIAYGRCSSYAELEKIREHHNVPKVNAMIDSGYRAGEVYRFVASTGKWVSGKWNGWKAFKGDSAEYFLHLSVDPQNPTAKKTVRRIWRKTLQDPMFGTAAQGKCPPIPLYMFAADQTKDLLATFMTGQVGEWTIPKSVSREYLRQVTAERREEVSDSRGRVRYVWKRIAQDNHLLDCELMILVGALISGAVQNESSKVRILDKVDGQSFNAGEAGQLEAGLAEGERDRPDA